MQKDSKSLRKTLDLSEISRKYRFKTLIFKNLSGGIPRTPLEGVRLRRTPDYLNAENN